MKALQLVPAMEEGGVEHYVVAVNRILTGAGWENVVVSTGGRLEATVAAEGGRCLRADLKSKNPLTVPFRAAKLRKILRAERPDVVCVHSRVPGWLFALASHGLKIPLISFAHGANSISRYSKIMTRGKVVACPSTFVRDYLIAAYGTPADRFRVIPHGIDATRFDPSNLDKSFLAEKSAEWHLQPPTSNLQPPTSDLQPSTSNLQPFTIMSVGRLTRLKGTETLIRAFKIFAGSVPNTRLVIVGGPEKGRESRLDELKALAAGLPVAFAGSQTRIPECLALADVVVSANTAKPESFGLSMAEALAMGKPVIARAFGGALDIVRDGLDGELVRGDDATDWARAFAEALTRVAAKRYDAAELRASALERFSFARMAERTLALYDAVTTSPAN